MEKRIGKAWGGRIAVLAVFGAAALACVWALAGAQPALAQETDAGALSVSTLQAQAAAPAKGDVFVKGGNTYKVTELAEGADCADVVLVKYGASSKKPVINTVTYQGQVYEVEAIGKNAFSNAKGRKIVSVVLGKHVDKIGAKAFYGCKKLKVIDMAKADVVDIDKERGGYILDGTDIGAKAFKGTGTASLKVKCGKTAKAYRALYKKALVKKGLRTSATVVK